jgi:hypothetical protein
MAVLLSWHPAGAAENHEKRGKNAAVSEQFRTSPWCKLLCWVSVMENQLPEKTCGKRTRWLTGAPVNQRVGLFRSHNVGPAKGPAFLLLLLPPHGPGNRSAPARDLTVESN